MVGEQSTFEVDVLEAGEMGRCEDLSDYDKGQITVKQPRHTKAQGVLWPRHGECLLNDQRRDKLV